MDSHPNVGSLLESADSAGRDATLLPLRQRPAEGDASLHIGFSGITFVMASNNSSSSCSSFFLVNDSSVQAKDGTCVALETPNEAKIAGFAGPASSAGGRCATQELFVSHFGF